MLPSNPFTISDQRLQANLWNAESIRTRYKSRAITAENIDADFRELHAWDTFTRSTDPSRESAKSELQRLRNSIFYP